MSEKIVKILKDVWESFKKYYDENASKYSDEYYEKRLQELGEKKVTKINKELKNSHWICWDEYDLMFHIGRSFYNKIKENDEFKSVELHFEKNVNRGNFFNRGYDFENKLDDFKNRLIKEGVVKKAAPKIDIIVTQEDSGASFLLCAEVKCFRGKTRYDTTPIDLINSDIKKLKALKDLKIAEEVFFILFDDYYYCHDEKTANEIKQRLNKIREQNNITVLCHTSKEKLRNECGFRADC